MKIGKAHGVWKMLPMIDDRSHNRDQHFESINVGPSDYKVLSLMDHTF